MPGQLRRNTLRKNERLFEKKAIDSVFDDGRSIVEQPVKLLWLCRKNGDGTVEAGFTVPGKNFGRAVDRNLLKRRMREAYRKNKHILYTAVKDKKANCFIMFIYVNKRKSNYAEIESKIVLTLQHLVKNLVNEKDIGVYG